MCTIFKVSKKIIFSSSTTFRRPIMTWVEYWFNERKCTHTHLITHWALICCILTAFNLDCINKMFIVEWVFNMLVGIFRDTYAMLRMNLMAIAPICQANWLKNVLSNPWGGQLPTPTRWNYAPEGKPIPVCELWHALLLPGTHGAATCFEPCEAG